MLALLKMEVRLLFQVFHLRVVAVQIMLQQGLGVLVRVVAVAVVQAHLEHQVKEMLEVMVQAIQRAVVVARELLELRV
jgi:hypothetical protein